MRVYENVLSMPQGSMYSVCMYCGLQVPFLTRNADTGLDCDTFNLKCFGISAKRGPTLIRTPPPCGVWGSGIKKGKVAKPNIEP